MIRFFIRSFIFIFVFFVQFTAFSQVVFTPSTDHITDTSQGEHSIKKEGITVSGTKCKLDNTEYYRFYVNSYLTISTNTGTIEKIVLNRYGTNGEDLSSNVTFPSSGKFATKEKNKIIWSGSTNTVTFYIEAAIWIATIEIEAIGNTDVRDDPATPAPSGLSFSETAVDATIGQPFTPPTLNNPNSLPVTYHSSNEDLAFVDNSGNVTLGTSEGVVTITAETVGNATHEAGSASYTITISKQAISNVGAFTLVNNASALRTGDEVLIVFYQTDEANYDIAMSTEEVSNHREFTKVEENKDHSITAFNSKTAIFTLEGNENAWKFKDKNGYLSAISSSADHIGTQAEADENSTASVEITNGNATICFKGYYTHNTIRYNNQSGGGYFSCYLPDDTYRNEPVQIYKRYALESDQFYISESGYATICLNHAFIMPNGITGHTISDATEHLTYGDEFFADEIVPANVPLLIEGSQGYHTYYKPIADATFNGTNLLVGSNGSMVNDDGYLYYKLAYKSASEKIVGFYWDSVDGKSIELPAGKAYLRVPQSVAAKSYTFDDATTDLFISKEAPHAGTIYSLQGIAMGTDLRMLKPGIYIVNGKKTVVK